MWRIDEEAHTVQIFLFFPLRALSEHASGKKEPSTNEKTKETTMKRRPLFEEKGGHE